MSAQTDMDTDPFTSLLHLEDTLYTTAYASGVAAGAHAGRIEGRIFGLEKGFEKFAALGVLHGRAVVWGARIPQIERRNRQSERGEVRGDAWHEGGDEVEKTNAVEAKEKRVRVGESSASASSSQQAQKSPSTPSLPILPSLPENPRLQKHISTLHALAEPLTFSTLNTEDAVADLDERVKRAGAKVKIIERMVGEVEGSEKESEERGREGGGGKAGRRSVRVSGEGGARGKGKGDEGMEDFSIKGVRGIRI